MIFGLGYLGTDDLLITDDGIEKLISLSAASRSAALALLLLRVAVSSGPPSRWAAVGQRKPSASPLCCVSTRTGLSCAPAIAGSTRRRAHLPTPSWGALPQPLAPESAPPTHLEHQLGLVPVHKHAHLRKAHVHCCKCTHSIVIQLYIWNTCTITS